MNAEEADMSDAVTETEVSPDLPPVSGARANDLVAFATDRPMPLHQRESLVEFETAGAHIGCIGEHFLAKQPHKRRSAAMDPSNQIERAAQQPAPLNLRDVRADIHRTVGDRPQYVGVVRGGCHARQQRPRHAGDCDG